MMKGLIVGLGSIGQRHLQNIKYKFNNQIQIQTFRQKKKNIVIKNAKKIKKNFNKFYNIINHKNLNSALAEFPDFVLICNPSSLHEKIIKKILQKKINFFVEKPALTSTKNIKKICNIVKKNKIINMVGFQQRFNPILIEIKKIIEKKKFGKIINSEFKWHTFLPDHHKYENYKKSYAAQKKLGGGVTFSLIHEIDIIQWFFGMPKKIISFKNKHKRIKINAEESIQSFLFFQNAFGKFNIYLSLSFAEKKNERVFKIFFEKVTLECNLIKNNFNILSKNKTIIKKKIKINNNDLFKKEINYFINSINKNKIDNTLSFAEGCKSVLIAEKILKSSANQRLIKL